MKKLEAIAPYLSAALMIYSTIYAGYLYHSGDFKAACFPLAFLAVSGFLTNTTVKIGTEKKDASLPS